jgi:UDP-N-acetylbacillosamine N-acetyltransferase
VVLDLKSAADGQRTYPPARLEKVVIWGASGHALVVADIVRAAGQYELIGFLDDTASGQMPLCEPVLGSGELLSQLRDRDVDLLVVAVGDCDARLTLADAAESAGFRLATAVHPRAHVAAGVQIGPGTVVAAGAIINPGAKLGQNVIINTGATVDHECVVDDGAHIGPGAHLGGRVRVGRAAWLGIGAIVTDRVTIGARANVGAGAVVLRDVPEAVVAYGVPAIVQRRRGPPNSLMDQK